MVLQEILAEREGFEPASQPQTKDLTAHGQHQKYMEDDEEPPN